MNSETFSDMELALIRGFKMGVTNIGRIDPSVELMRTKAGASGGVGGVRLIDVADYKTDPAWNPMWSQLKRTNTRLGDTMLDTRLQASELSGR